MALGNTVKFFITAIDKASKEFKNVEKSVDSTKKSAEKAEKSFLKMGAKVAAVSGAIAAMGAAAVKAFEFAEQGAQLQLTEERFGRLTRTIGTTADILGRDLQRAMGGIVSEAEAMALGTDLLSLGLVKSKEEAARMATVVGQLGMDMNQLVLTLTNQTTMRFDALGVSVDGFDEKYQALRETMTDQEAFKMAFLEQSEEQLAKVGSVADTAAGEFMQLKAAWKDWMDGVKKGMADVLTPYITKINDVRDAKETLKEAVQRGFITQGD